MSSLRDIAHHPPTIPNLRLANQFLPGTVDQLRRYVQRLQNNTTPQGLRELQQEVNDLEHSARLDRRELQTLTQERDHFKRLAKKAFKKNRKHRRKEEERQEENRQTLKKVKKDIFWLSYYLREYRDQFGYLPGDYAELHLEPEYCP